MRLKDKVILVTGAASGIGQACARRCAAEGAEVVGVDRQEGDVACEKDVEEIFSRCRTLDGLVHCAGIAVRHPADEQDAAGWDEVMRVNARGAWLVSRCAVGRMKERGGSIVHMASVVGLVGVRNRAAYSASKGAIVSLTRNLALDYAPYRIRVNCVCPGFTRTPLTEKLFASPERARQITRLHPLGRLGEPDDIAHLAVFLLSEEASWITGQAIAVDGGFTAGHAADI